MERNSEDTQIWLLSAVKHIFSQVDRIELDYSERTDRNKLEDVYLEIITPLIDGADDVITQGRQQVHHSGDDYIKQALGLSFPEDGPGLLDCAEYLRDSKSIGVLLEDEFRRCGSVPEYPIVAKSIKYKTSMNLLYLFPDLVKVVFDTLRRVSCRITMHEAHQTCLKDFLSPSQIQLWNDLWRETKSMSSLVDNIHIPEEYLDMILTADSTLADFLPSKTGPGACSWFMINNLALLYNQFAKGPTIDIVTLTKFVTPPCIAKHEVVAVTYDTYDGSGFDLELLEESLIMLFNVRNRCAVDGSTVAQLLFQPLKNVDSWYKILEQVRGAYRNNRFHFYIILQRKMNDQINKSIIHK